ncbi:hypothetical protein HAX54_014130 [Datura stramonium]|uniref:Uncharacterized protein n=1 Tax=Datura stramonium TaxID=4076 RepID=A0ABS8TPC9_DATST|nr:hypothetical protein [Datura stramonium]
MLSRRVIFRRKWNDDGGLLVCAVPGMSLVRVSRVWRWQSFAGAGGRRGDRDVFRRHLGGDGARKKIGEEVKGEDCSLHFASDYAYSLEQGPLSSAVYVT